MKADTIRITKHMTREAYCRTSACRALLTVCEVSVFCREILQLSKIHPPPSLRSS